MSTVPPLPRRSAEPGWWERNWKWAVPVMVAGLLALFAAFLLAIFGGVLGMMKSSDAFKVAMQRAQASPAAQAALGSPIRDGWLVTGNIRVDGATGEANLAIPVSGPKGEGDLYLEATKSAGEWTFQTLALKPDAGPRIDLLQEPAPASQP